MTTPNQTRMRQLLSALPTAETAAKNYANMAAFYAGRLAVIKNEIELIKRDDALRDETGVVEWDVNAMWHPDAETLLKQAMEG